MPAIRPSLRRSLGPVALCAGRARGRAGPGPGAATSPFGRVCTATNGVRFCPTTDGGPGQTVNGVSTFDGVPLDVDVTLSGARIRLRGHAVTTRANGQAAMTLALPHAGAFKATISMTGFRSVKATLHATAPPAPPPGPPRFTGWKTVSGRSPMPAGARARSRRGLDCAS